MLASTHRRLLLPPLQQQVDCRKGLLDLRLLVQQPPLALDDVLLYVLILLVVLLQLPQHFLHRPICAGDTGSYAGSVYRC